MKVFKQFMWVNMIEKPTFDVIKTSADAINRSFPDKIDTDGLIDEFALLISYIDAKVEPFGKSTSCEFWMQCFQHFDTQNLPLPNILRIVEFVLSFPATNAFSERLFSYIERFWTKDKSQLKMDAIKAAVIVDVNININIKCKDMYSLVLSNEKLQKALQSSDKYKNPMTFD